MMCLFQSKPLADDLFDAEMDDSDNEPERPVEKQPDENKPEENTNKKIADILNKVCRMCN